MSFILKIRTNAKGKHLIKGGGKALLHSDHAHDLSGLVSTEEMNSTLKVLCPRTRVRMIIYIKKTKSHR